MAISAQTPERSLETVNKHELEYHVLSDVNLEVARQFGLVFKLSPEMIDTYKNYGVDLKDYNGNEDYELPVPGYYVIDRQGTIRWAYANPEHKVRPDAETLIAVLESLSEGGEK